MKSLTQKRAAYLRKRMEDSATWMDVLEKEIHTAQRVGDKEEASRLSYIYEREKSLYNALRRALVANQDTLAIL